MKIERTLADGAWTYTDPAVQQASVDLLLLHGISLEAIDDWIEAGPWAPEQLAQVMDWRTRMLTTDSAEAAEAWGMFLTTLVHLNTKVLPLAVMGKRQSEGNRARRKGKPGSYDSPHGPERNQQIKRFHARLLAQGRHDATQETAQEFGVSTRTVRRIVNS